MNNYVSDLMARQREAIAEDAFLVKHFGEDAKDCENWQDLFARAWSATQSNSSGAVHLPEDEKGEYIGCWLDTNHKVHANLPSLYSDKTVYILARQLVDGGPALVVAYSALIGNSDEVDCDQLTCLIDTLGNYLKSNTVWKLDGTGYSWRPFGNMEADDLFAKWKNGGAAGGIFVSQKGIIVAHKPNISPKAATNALAILQRQIEARRRILASAENVCGVSATAQQAPPPPPDAEAYPWAKIDTLAERIGLRKLGRFVPADKWVPKAVAGMIDALREAGIISETATLPAQYDDFAAHYNCNVGGGRDTKTRREWRSNARRDLGLI